MKTKSNFFPRRLLGGFLLTCGLLNFRLHAQSTYWWLGQDAYYGYGANWNYNNNFSAGEQGSPLGYSLPSAQNYLNFGKPYNNSLVSGLTNFNNGYGAAWQIYFKSDAPAPYILWGSSLGSITPGLAFYDFSGTDPNIQNEGTTYTPIINFAITNGNNNGTYRILNINLNSTPAQGPLIFNGPIYGGAADANSRVINVGGGNVTFNGIIANGTGGGTLGLTQLGAGIVTLTASNTFTGDLAIDAGTVVLATNNAVAASTNFIRLGNTTGSSGAYLNLNGGSSLSTAINIRSGSTGGKIIANTAGTTGAATFAGNLYLDDNVTLYANTNSSLAGNILSGITLDIKSHTLYLDGPGTNLITGALTNSISGGSLVKNGPGTLTLANANTYSGTTTVNAGVLNIQNASALGATTAGTIVSNNAELQIQGGLTTAAEPLTLNGTGTNGTDGALRNLSGTNTFAGPIALGSASLIGADAGTLTLSATTPITGNYGLTFGGAGSAVVNSPIQIGNNNVTVNSTGGLTLNASNSYSANTTINTGGLLNLGNAYAMGTSKLTFGGNGSFDNTSGGPLIIANALSMSSGSASFVGTSDLTLNGAVTVSGANRTLTVSSGNLTFGGPVGDSGQGRALTKAGNGTLILTQASTHSGGTTISGGALSIGNDSSLGTGLLTLAGGTLQSSSGTRTLANNASLTANCAIGGANPIVLNGTFTESGGSRTLTLNNSALTTLAGNVYLSDNNTTTGRGLTFSGAGNLLVSGAISNNAAGNTVATSLTFAGSGTVTLAGTNSFTGPVAINGGVILVNGEASGSTGNFLVASNAMLGGSGKIGGNITFATGALATNVLGSPLTILGALTNNNNNLNIFIPGGTPLAAGSYPVMTYGGALSGTFNSLPSLTGAGIAANTSASIQTGGGNVLLVVSLNTLPTTTCLTNSVNSSTYGQLVNFTATIKTNSVTAIAATGNIVFMLDGISVATNSVSAGQAVYGTSNLTAGAHVIIAQYAGDYNYQHSTNTLTQTVNPAPLSITASNAAKTYGQTYNASAASVAVNGLANGETIGVVTIIAAGGTNTNAGIGAYALTPSSASGGTFAATNYSITYNAGTLMVNPLAVALSGTRAYNGSNDIAGALLAVTNLVNPDALTLTGGALLGGTNVGTWTITNLTGLSLSSGVGTNYTFTGASGFVTITQAACAVVVTSSSPTNGYLASVAFTAALPAFAVGNVIFLTNGTVLNSINLLGGTAATPAISSLPRGTNLITVQYAGNSNLFGSTNSLSQIVTNHPPVAYAVSYSRGASNAWRIFVSDLLTNATDADGDTLTLTIPNPSTNGITLTISNGLVRYCNTNPVGDQFNYTVTDGYGGTNTATISIIYSNSLVGQITGQFTSFSNGVASLTFQGIPNYSYITERSTNLTGWVDIVTNTAATNGVIDVTDFFSDLGSNAPSSAYYRLKYK